MAKVSVIIPLFNKAPYIARAIKSVLHQTVAPAEIIVVDDGSEDGGGELVKQFLDRRIRLVRQENRGVGAARNLGVSLAQGDLVAFLDADDAWESRFLEVISALRRNYPAAGAYATAYRYLDPRVGLTKRPFKIFSVPHLQSGLIDNYFQVALELPICASAVAVPKEVMVATGGFPMGEVMGEDEDTWLRIALHYPIAWSSECLAVYHLEAANRTVGFKRWADKPSIYYTARAALAAGLVPQDRLAEFREYVTHYLLMAARDCLVMGNKGPALELLQYTRGTTRFVWNWWKWRLAAALPGNPGPRLWRAKQQLKRWGIGG